jgi:ABC-2 type transport system permease protein
MTIASIQPPPQVRHIGRVNWEGLKTLYLKEVRRFAKVATQTVLAPLVTTLLFLAIFVLALGRSVDKMGGVTFMEFLAPGLIMMTMVQNAFANTSSSILIAKVQGNIVDVLMPPLSPGELTAGFALGGMTRGLLVGMLGAIWAEKFDHLAAVTNFVITPLAFLSGTFYSVERLPGYWAVLAHLNPFFYMIDGFRYGFIGHADGSLAAGIAVMALANAALWALVHRLFATGYRLKA